MELTAYDYRHVLYALSSTYSLFVCAMSTDTWYGDRVRMNGLLRSPLIRLPPQYAHIAIESRRTSPSIWWYSIIRWYVCAQNMVFIWIFYALEINLYTRRLRCSVIRIMYFIAKAEADTPNLYIALAMYEMLKFLYRSAYPFSFYYVYLFCVIIKPFATLLLWAAYRNKCVCLPEKRKR